MKLEAVTAEPLPGALELLLALGEGENGFGGTPVGRDAGKLGEWLDYCVHIATAPALSEEFVPQANYWISDDFGQAVGLVRLRPRLNAQLLSFGGHLGYYIAPAFRGRGYGKAGLRLALRELRTRGVARALVTVEAGNVPSLRLVASLGGIFEDERVDEETGLAYRRFWLDTGPV
jgi:predicted acetyltransferase